MPKVDNRISENLEILPKKMKRSERTTCIVLGYRATVRARLFTRCVIFTLRKTVATTISRNLLAVRVQVTWFDATGDGYGKKVFHRGSER